jgi:hypothetical protein
MSKAYAHRTSREIKNLFGKLGNSEHPNGAILRAYRVARRAIKDNPDDALFTLRIAVQQALTDVLGQAKELGINQADRELESFGVATQNVYVPVDVEPTMGILDTQIKAAQALMSVDEKLVIGDKNRVGLLSPAPVTREGNKWITLTALIAWGAVIKRSLETAGIEKDFQKQAVALIDKNTTECCQRVNGQIQDLDKPFKLTGNPRFADEMLQPPFHYYCRTSQILVKRNRR